ncbi:oligosaccharide flippase family protein [Rathayibacter festucae]|uniref:oligosaccharide flippase family protein n=1 Tax=Rathayibacter festucae TaxID=110937 RepID=UPI0013E39B4F|nr:oligosaccharide flippase family protein [Rathayibacter festucae]
MTTSGADESGRMGRNVALATLGNAFAPLAALATAPIMAQSLGVAGRGDVAAATAPLFLATTAATFGIPAAVNYSIARHPRLMRSLALRGTVLIAFAGVIASTAVFLAAGFLSGGDPDLRGLIVLAASAIIPGLCVALLQAVAAGSHQWGLVARERFLTAATRLAAFIAFAATGHLTVFWGVVILALSPVLGGFAYFGLKPASSTAESDARTVVTMHSLLGYGVRVWIGSISGVLLTRLDQTLMTPLAGSFALGLYVVAVSISELPLIVNNAVREVTFSADAAENSDSRLGLSSRLSTLAALAAAITIGATLWWWLPPVFGDEFLPAIPVTVILLGAVVLGNPGSIAGIGLSSRGRPGTRSMSLLISCVVNAAMLILLAPVLGAVGAALATLIGNVLASNLNIFFLWKHFGVSPADFYLIRRSDFGVLAIVFRKLMSRFHRG